jgi:hypothetical protein
MKIQLACLSSKYPLFYGYSPFIGASRAIFEDSLRIFQRPVQDNGFE